MRKLLARILVLVMLIGIIPMNVFATEEAGGNTSRSTEVMYSGTDGDLEWSIDKNWHLTVTGEGYPEEYDGWDNPWGETQWMQYCEKIVSADIDVMCSDFSGFFSGWTSLKTLDLSKVDMYCVDSADNFFEGCVSLEKIYTPLNVSMGEYYSEEYDVWYILDEYNIELPCSSENVWAGNEVWIGEDGIRYMNLPEKSSESILLTKYAKDNVPDTKVVYSGTEGNLSWTIDSMGCFVLNGSGTPEEKEWESYADVIYSVEINAKNITSLADFCSELSNVIYVDLSGMDASKLTDMSRMFCTEWLDNSYSKLREVKFGNIDTSNVTDMSYLFYNCGNLETVDLENLNTQSVTDMSYMFSGCTWEEIDMSHFDMSNVTDADDMFVYYSEYDESLYVNKIHTPINLKINVELPTLNSREGWQDDDNNIYKTLPKNTTESIVIELKTKTVTGGDGEVHSGKSGDINWEIDEKGHLTVSGTGDLYFDEETWEYDDWSEYTDIIVSAEFNVKGMTDIYLFDSLYYLKTLDMSNFDMSDVFDEYDDGFYIFYDCESLETIKTPVNLNVYVELPMDNGQLWTDENGNVYEYLPQNLSTSIVLTTKGIEEDENECETNGHSWDSGKVTTTATCTKEGVKTYTCTVCSETKTETIAKTDHTWNKEYTTVKEATCTEKGSKNIQCSVCKAVKEGSTVEIAAKGHNYTSKVTEPTETEKGYTTYTCSVCNHSYKDNYTDPKGSGDTGSDNAGFGEAAVYRIWGDNRYETSYSIANALKAQQGVDKFNTVILADGNNFPDALAGSYLAAKYDAPILMASKKNADTLKAYIKENVAAFGTIYVLGGTSAIPDTLLSGLDSYKIKRIAGANRYETNLGILNEAGVTNEPILVCTGTGFADSLSASATGYPILLVKKSLTAEQKAFLAEHSGNKIYIIGGTSAVTTALETQLKQYGSTTRIAGANRYATSTAVAETFFADAKVAVLAYAQNYPDGLCGGPLAMSKKAPLILTETKKCTVAVEYLQAKKIEVGAVLGGEGLISDDAVKKIFSASSITIW